jgi:hypothetical protein
MRTERYALARLPQSDHRGANITFRLRTFHQGDRFRFEYRCVTQKPLGRRGLYR